MALGTPLTEHLPSGDLLIAIEDLTGIPLHVLFCPHLDDCPLAKEGLIPRPDQTSPAASVKLCHFLRLPLPDHQQTFST